MSGVWQPGIADTDTLIRSLPPALQPHAREYVESIPKVEPENPFETIWEATVAGLKATGAAIGNFLGDIGESISKAIAEVGDFIDRAVDWVGDKTGFWPVALDLDGDGIEASVGDSVSFDIDGDGFVERTAWISPDDALLVIDLNADGSQGAGDGKINLGREVAFSLWTENKSDTDLQALAIFDRLDRGGNANGFIDTGDAAFKQLKDWDDKNMNGEVDEGELKTLAAHSITKIGLSYDGGDRFGDATDDYTLGRASLVGKASLYKGSELLIGAVGDLWLTETEFGW